MTYALMFWLSLACNFVYVYLWRRDRARIAATQKGDV